MIEQRLAEIEARAKRLMEGCVVEECAVCAGERERLRLVAALRVAVDGLDVLGDSGEFTRAVEAALKGDEHAG